jgi:hypothetical protein
MLTLRSRLAALSHWERRHDGAFLRRPGDPLGEAPLPGAPAARALAWSRACDREARGLVARLAAARRHGLPPSPEAVAGLARLRRSGLAWRDAADAPQGR